MRRWRSPNRGGRRWRSGGRDREFLPAGFHRVGITERSTLLSYQLTPTAFTTTLPDKSGNGAYLLPTLMRSPMFIPEPSLANTEDTAVVLKGYVSSVLAKDGSGRNIGDLISVGRRHKFPMLLPEPSLANTEDTAVVPKRYGSGVLTVPRSLLVSQEYSTACHRLLVSASMSYSALVLNRYLVPFGYLPASVRGFARGRTKGTPRNRSLRWKSVKGVFVCLECKWKFNSPKALTEHFKRCHLEIYELNIRCTHCGNCFNSPTDKKDHACVLPDTLSSVSQFRNFKLAELQQRNRAKKLLPCCPEMEVDGIFAEANEFAVLNPENLCCVEKGLKLRDGDIGGDVTPLIPPSEVEVNSNNS
ncbi:hypothetical protein PHJA_001489400 [Phtheirospermum japonicum]|uniref:C2H2-type domain-containing protein n=1 Tax=Phtheirospermum japonicum TaxID=374723 RepID=A0A830C1C1_9LAMI|nr:hypothetical protein PHJA_001489400 [Phtheirospermum japonicum]